MSKGWGRQVPDSPWICSRSWPLVFSRVFSSCESGLHLSARIICPAVVDIVVFTFAEPHSISISTSACPLLSCFCFAFSAGASAGSQVSCLLLLLIRYHKCWHGTPRHREAPPPRREIPSEHLPVISTTLVPPPLPVPSFSALRLSACAMAFSSLRCFFLLMAARGPLVGRRPGRAPRRASAFATAPPWRASWPILDACWRDLRCLAARAASRFLEGALGFFTEGIWWFIIFFGNFLVVCVVGCFVCSSPGDSTEREIGDTTGEEMLWFELCVVLFSAC